METGREAVGLSRERAAGKRPRRVASASGGGGYSGYCLCLISVIYLIYLVLTTGRVDSVAPSVWVWK